MCHLLHMFYLPPSLFRSRGGCESSWSSDSGSVTSEASSIVGGSGMSHFHELTLRPFVLEYRVVEIVGQDGEDLRLAWVEYCWGTAVVAQDAAARVEPFAVSDLRWDAAALCPSPQSVAAYAAAVQQLCQPCIFGHGDRAVRPFAVLAEQLVQQPGGQARYLRPDLFISVAAILRFLTYPAEL